MHVMPEDETDKDVFVAERGNRYLWSSELYPTSVRHGGMSLGSLSARVGSVGAPWAAQVGVLLADALGFDEGSNLRADLPLALFGFAAVFSGLCAAVRCRCLCLLACLLLTCSGA